MNKLNLDNSIILITGADGGIGQAFVKELILRGVKKIYISGINLDKLKELASIDQRLIPVKLDVTSETDINSCLEKCNDINGLINNAGIELKSSILDNNFLSKFDKEVSINFKGPVNLTNSFLNILKEKDSPFIVNILSIGSLIMIDNISSYCYSKVLLHLYSQNLRNQCELNEIKIFNVYPGYVDTNLVSDVLIDKISPSELVKNICEDMLNGKLNIFPDKMSQVFESSNKLNIDYLNL